MSDAQLPLFGDPGDRDARDAIAARLHETLFVEAGAGTGKTFALVNRIVALVTRDDAGPVAMRNVAAITFTEKAAAELRERVRLALLALESDPEQSDLVRERSRAALDELDIAAICTLHSFAQRILTEFPIEAGLPPRLQILDEISSAVAFDTRWRHFVDELLDDVALQDAILVVLAAGVRLEHLRVVAEVLDDNWDLLDRVGPVDQVPRLEVEQWLAELEAVCALASSCSNVEDRLVARLDELSVYAARIRHAVDDAERVTLLRAAKPSFRAGNCGNQRNWPDISAVRDEVARLGEARTAIVTGVLDVAIRQIAAALARGTAAAVAERRAAGELEFHDLLVLARTLLRDPQHGARARDRLRRRYQRILIDEFQDTDPIQVELAALLGSDDPDDGARPWTEMTVEPGRLFFVGDPKQSIYRFRRADIGIFLDAQATFAGKSPVYLTCNFRAAAPVLDWVNTVFADLIRPYPGSQPEYRALEPARSAAPDGPAVALLGVEAHDDAPNAEALREREAADVVAAVQAAIGEQWEIVDRGEPRPARLGDICILLPARTSLGYLERALDDAGVPYRAETSSLVYASRVVRDILAAVRAVDDPSNELALVTALRSTLFGCGDDDLFTYHVVHRGSWDLGRDAPETIDVEHPVVVGMRELRALHEERMWLAPSELMERLVRDCKVLEHAALDGRFRDVARRVRFLVDQARAFGETAGGSLRDYLAWAELQGAEGARVVESVLPETDDDAVRIMTIHSAKGLEFPIVVCSGMTTAAQARRAGVQVLFPPAGGYQIRLARDVQTDQFELHLPIDEQMGFHEKLRLLYVACTRARDHLVVSVHRKARDLDVDGDRSRWTHAELVWTAAQAAEWIEFEELSVTRRRETAPRGAVAAPLPPEEWDAEHARAFAHGVRRRSVAATTLAHRDEVPAVPIDPGLAKEPRDLELPPWNKGRYGTAIGRAVHGVLQTVDLVTGEGLEAAVAAQAAAEGVLGHEATISALCRAALESDSVRRARDRSCWREVYVAVPLEGLTLEGYVDLLSRGPDGLIIVDYKTDAVADDTTLAARVDRYRVQIAAYAVAVEEVTGEHVARCVLCFLHPDGAHEVVIEGPELADAVDEVRRRVRAENDDPSPLPVPVLAEA